MGPTNAEEQSRKDLEAIIPQREGFVLRAWTHSQAPGVTAYSYTKPPCYRAEDEGGAAFMRVKSAGNMMYVNTLNAKATEIAEVARNSVHVCEVVTPGGNGTLPAGESGNLAFRCGGQE